MGRRKIEHEIKREKKKISALEVTQEEKSKVLLLSKRQSRRREQDIVASRRHEESTCVNMINKKDFSLTTRHV